MTKDTPTNHASKSLKDLSGTDSSERIPPGQPETPTANQSATHKEDPPETHKEQTLRELMARRKRELNRNFSNTVLTVEDPFECCLRSLLECRRKTAVLYNPVVNSHFCTWDSKYPEKPARIECIYDKCNEFGLIERCERLSVNSDECTDQVMDEILKSAHKEAHIQLLKNICQLPPHDIEAQATEYDSVYFNENTYAAAKFSAASVLKLAKEVAIGNYKNGFAIVRPPGHHAMENAYNGYCLFNNVAIAAEQLITEKLAKKILIVDYDVHHGQGTQRKFYNRSDVLYFSIHRYEHGTFWPNLKESNYNYIGNGTGKGYNINVPLNATRLGDSEYLAIVFNILLPVAYEYNPDIILISAGYDAAIGCPEGEMLVTPAFYGHLITLLGGLASGKLVVALEGGYFLPSLAEAGAMTLKALLGDPCGPVEPVVQIHPVVVEVINNLKFTLREHWNCFKSIELFDYPKDTADFESKIKVCSDEHLVTIKYCGKPELPPYPIKNCYPLRSQVETDFFNGQIESLDKKYKSVPILPVGFVYDEFLTKHKSANTSEQIMPERPERITEIMKILQQYGLDKRCLQLENMKHNEFQYLSEVHDVNYIENLPNLKIKLKNDMYTNKYTSLCIQHAINAILTVADAVCECKISSGAAIIRPPGHHAHRAAYSGFCFVNNVATAANYVIQKYKLKRVLIVDFDVHHGDGTQQITYNRNDIMYMSVHRFDHGNFFPSHEFSNYNFCGEGPGEGYNINIPFNDGKMGNTEYVHVFHNIILPIAYSYAPDLVIVSAGFDAGVGDHLGQYHVAPELFGHFIQLLKSLANGKIIVALEGGYKLETVSLGFAMCIKALLDDPLPLPELKPLNPAAVKTTINVINTFKQYWPILQLNKKVSNGIYSPYTLWGLKHLLVRKITAEANNRRHDLKELEKDFVVLEEKLKTACKTFPADV